MAQLADNSGGSYYPQTTQYQFSPAPQDQSYDTAAGTADQGLPDDWPQTITVTGMEQVEGLVQGDNNISYSINIISQDSSGINFQVNAFCVYNPVSDYAILHIPNKPLMGVIDQDKKTLQIDFSPLSAGVKTEIINKADVDKVLMQDPKSLVLNTVMTVESTDSSQTNFDISDMSLLQPDGTLDQFSLPGPLPAVYSPSTDRFSTVGFNELANVLQQNYVSVQQNTYVNVVNVVNQVNVVNVANFGDYGGYDGYGGYGGYDGYGDGSCGNFMPYTDPLPMADPQPVSPLTVPNGVPVYDSGKMHGHASGLGDNGRRHKDYSTGSGDNSLKSNGYSAATQPMTTGGYNAQKTKRADGNRQAYHNTNQVQPASVISSGSTPNVKRTTSVSAPVAGTNLASAKVPTTKQVTHSAPITTPATRTNVAKANIPATKTVTAPQSKAAVQSRPYTQPAKATMVKQASAPRAVTHSAQAVARAPVSSAHSSPVVAHTATRGGGHR